LHGEFPRVGFVLGTLVFLLAAAVGFLLGGFFKSLRRNGELTDRAAE
jgi:hypothetical protein